MRKLWNSNLGRRLSCLALTLVMVLSLLPVRASAVTVGRNIEVLTGEATQNGGGSNGDLAFNFEKLELEWYPKDESVGRNQDGWWIGIRVTMPDGADPETAAFTTQRFDGAESKKISFKDARDGENNVITLWAFIDEETAHTYANSSSNSYMIYRFYWWKGETRTQGINLSLDPRVLTLKKDGKVVYNGLWEYSNGEISAPEGYTYDTTGVACAPEIELALTSEDVPYLTKQDAGATTTGRAVDGWYAPFVIERAYYAKSGAQYRKQGESEGTPFTGERLTVYTLLAEDAESAQNLHDVSEAWEFDWDGDGAYEQKVTVRVAESARLERNFKFSAPITGTVTVPQEKALVATTGVEGWKTLTSEYTEGDGTTEIKQENGQYYVTFNKPGTIRITASAPDDGVFAAAKDSYTFPVTRDEQAISFDMTDPWIVVNVDPRYTTQTYRQTAKNTLGRTVTYSIEKQTTPEGEYATIATIDSANGQMTILRSGEITVRAETPKDDRYEASSATYTLTVKRAKDDSILTFDVETSEANPAQVIYGKKEYYIKPDGHNGNVSLTNGLPQGLSDGTFTDQGLHILLEDNATGLFTVSFTRAADKKYEAVTKNFYLQISYVQAPNPAYVVTGETKNNSGWYTGPVTVSAPEGWELSATDNKLWGNTSWTEALPAITADGTYAKENIYLRHMNGNITDAIERREIKIDQTAPTRLSSRAYKKVGDQILEILSFGLFNAEIHYELSAQDATSGVEKFEYWFVDENGKVVEGKGGEVAADKNGKAEFVVQPDLKGTLHFVAYDVAGNRSKEMRGNEIVLEKTPPVCKAEYSKPVSENDTTCYYGGDKATVTLTLTDNERLMIKEDGEDSKLDATVRVNGVDTEVGWTISEDKKTATATVELTKEGTYIITVTAKDAAGNEMDEFISNTIVIDRTPASASATYAAPVSQNGTTRYYGDNTTVTLTLTDNERLMLTGTGDKLDATVKVDGTETAADWTVSEDGKTATATITLTEAGTHTVTVTVRDAAGNQMPEFTTDPQVIDRTALTAGAEYSKEISKNGTTRYYDDDATVTLTLTDDERLMLTDGELDATVKVDGAETAVDWTISEDGKTATATISFTEEGVHSVTVTAKDAAGNEMPEFTTEPQVIDRTAPVSEVSFDAPKRSKDGKDYYDGEFEARFTVTDVNLDPADITVTDNGAEITGLVWMQDEADPTLWTASCTVSGEGEHTVTMTAHDRANNGMAQYTSQILVIDETNPVIRVVYGNTDIKNTVDGISYFDREQTATIEITETNFSAEDVNLTVMAKDVTGKDIATEDFLAALHDEQKWSHENGRHTITVRFPVEANYTLSVACTDLAGRKAEDYGPDAFTVDATAPSDLGISYSTSLLDRVLEGVTFGYYNAPVTVTLTADDTVSGVHGILYSYAKALNVSGVNAELLNDAISAARIRRNGYTFTATFTIPKAVLTAANQFNGTVSFTATDRSGNAASYTDVRRTVVDTIRPAVEVTLTDPARKDGTTAYYAGTAGVTAKVNEANFYAEDVVFEVTRNGAAYPVSANWTNNSADLHTGTFSLTQEGEYVVKMRYTDRSGNVMQEYVSDTLIVDTTVPELTVTGVDADSANKDTPFGFVITAKDAHLDPDTLTVTLTAVVRDENGKYATKTVKLDPAEVVKAGEEYRITVKNLTEDAVYSLTCTVADRSGNVQKAFVLRDGKSYETINFSVNRNGSTFSVDENTAALLEQYYTYDVRNDVVIFETNVDPVEHYTVKLNGKELTEGADYTTTLSTEPGKWALRTYTLSKNLFAAEGSYNVVVESTDKTNTVAYSDVKSLDISFVVDQTAPVLTVSGLKTGGRYQTTEQTVTVIPTDDGGRLNSFRALVLDSDGTPLRNAAGEDISVRFDLSGDELHDYLKEHDGMITFTVPEGLENQVRLICGDCAAHADGTTNVCDELYERVTVSSNLLIIFFANKTLFYSVLGVLALLIVLIILLIVGKKRKSSKK